MLVQRAPPDFGAVASCRSSADAVAFVVGGETAASGGGCSGR